MRDVSSGWTYRLNFLDDTKYKKNPDYRIYKFLVEAANSDHLNQGSEELIEVMETYDSDLPAKMQKNHAFENICYKVMIGY